MQAWKLSLIGLQSVAEEYSVCGGADEGEQWLRPVSFSRNNNTPRVQSAKTKDKDT
jgi:hypothetical protein